MKLLDEIKRDREQGTPGPWGVAFGSSITTDYGMIADFRDAPPHPLSYEHNTKRCARVPEMEKALLVGLDPYFIAQVIRTIDGKHNMGAGELAENICAAIERADTE